MPSGLPVRARFSRESYNAIVEYLPAEAVREHLEKLYGDRLDASSEFVPDDFPLDVALARQFLFIDDRVRAPAEEAQSSLDAGSGPGIVDSPGVPETEGNED
jgi:hypothetical protein